MLENAIDPTPDFTREISEFFELNRNKSKVYPHSVNYFWTLYKLHSISEKMYLKNILFLVWYQQFDPTCMKAFHSDSRSFMNAIDKLNHFRIFKSLGVLAFFLGFVSSVFSAVGNIKGTDEMTFSGKFEKQRHLEKLPFDFLNGGSALTSGIGWCLLHASWVPPVFIAAAAIAYTQAAYELVVKTYQLNEFRKVVNLENEEFPDKKITFMQAIFGGSYYDKLNPKEKISTKDQYYRAVLEAHRAEMRLKVFQLGCAALALTFTAMWAPMPGVAVVCLLVTGLAVVAAHAYLKHKYVNPKLKKAQELSKALSKSDLDEIAKAADAIANEDTKFKRFKRAVTGFSFHKLTSKKTGSEAGTKGLQTAGIFSTKSNKESAVANQKKSEQKPKNLFPCYII